MKGIKRILWTGLWLYAAQGYTQTGADFSSLEWLYETGPEQRRDLSMPGSRIVINFFDFNSTVTPVAYSNSASLPLNAAYLTTFPNTEAKGKQARMSRAVSRLLSVYKSEGNDRYDSAVHFNTEWRPYALPFSATYADGSRVRGIDYFFDESVIARRLHLEGFKGDLVLRGIITGNTRTGKDRLTVHNGHMQYTIGVSRKAQITVRDGYWEMRIPVSPVRDSLNIAVAFSNGGDQARLAGLSKALALTDIQRLLQERKNYWLDLLNRLPQPGILRLQHVATYGVQPEQLKKAYYKAWIFTAQNLLPEDPDHFPFPQICTGKASLWDEGDLLAPFSAAWESFIGIQFYAYIDKQVAWKAFKGLMSLVDSTGMLGGESLPSRKAQTALLLFKMSGDTAALREVYLALNRYLNWRLQITHWVYGDLRPTLTLKDAEFAFSALIDIRDMMSISEILNEHEGRAQWKTKHEELYRKSLVWFWEKPDTPPFQMMDLQTGKRTPGHALWVTTGLSVIPPLSGLYQQSMMKRFDNEFDPAKPFAGFSMPKYPDLAFTIRGLIQHGYRDKAEQLLEANLRDIVRARASFAEQYKPENLEPDGVRPSLFGSAALIDFCLLMNGYSYLEP